MYLHHTFYNYFPNTVDQLSMTIDGTNINVHALLTVGVFPPPVGTPVTVPLGQLHSGMYTLSIWATGRTGTDGIYGDSYLEDQVTFSVTAAPTIPLDAVEFRHARLNHYFITTDEAEKQTLLDGIQPGWVPTGQSFKVLTPAPLDVNLASVCRFYGSVTPGPNSHFYTLFVDECVALKSLAHSTPADEPRWNYEGLAFAAVIPEEDRTCPLSYPSSVRRFYNNRAAHNDSNHRYVTDPVIAQEMRDSGWTDEGIVMCGPSR